MRNTTYIVTPTLRDAELVAHYEGLDLQSRDVIVAMHPHKVEGRRLFHGDQIFMAGYDWSSSEKPAQAWDCLRRAAIRQNLQLEPVSPSKFVVFKR